MSNFKHHLVGRKETTDKHRQTYPNSGGADSSWDLPPLSPLGHFQGDATAKLRPHHHQQQLVPLSMTRPDSASSESGDERLRGLETRLRVAEKSNRALLEEVVRLQSELKVVSRRGEDALREERRARQGLEAALKRSGELVGQLAQRVRSQEERLAEERGRLDTLAEAGAKKDAQQARIAALEKELEGLEQARARAERTSARLMEEMRSLRSRVEEQQIQQNQMRTRHSSIQDLPPQASLATAEELTELRSRLRSEVEERRRLEHRLEEKIGEALKAATSAAAAANGGAGFGETAAAGSLTERLALQAKIQEAAEALNQRILEKEVRLREDAARSQAEAERLILREQEARLTQERESRHQQEQRWEALRKLHEEELAGARRLQRAELAEASEAIRSIQEAVQAMERRMLDQLKEATSAAVAAATTAADAGTRRPGREEEAAAERRQLTARLQEVEAKLASSSAAMTAEITAMGQRIRAIPPGSDKSQLESLLEDYRRETGRRVAGTEEQLLALKTRLDRAEERLGAKVGESNEATLKEMQERMEATNQRLGLTDSQVTELKSKYAAISDGVHRNTEQITRLIEELRMRVGAEIAGRVQDTDSIRMELERLRAASGGGGSAEFKRELEECQALVRKLAEAMQTVKTVLGMKIQSEQKLRASETKSLQEEVKQQKVQLDQVSKKVGESP